MHVFYFMHFLGFVDIVPFSLLQLRAHMILCDFRELTHRLARCLKHPGCLDYGVLGLDGGVSLNPP